MVEEVRFAKVLTVVKPKQTVGQIACGGFKGDGIGTLVDAVLVVVCGVATLDVVTLDVASVAIEAALVATEAVLLKRAATGLTVVMQMGCVLLGGPLEGTLVLSGGLMLSAEGTMVMTSR